MSKIYTKAGDKGTTTLYSGERVTKYDAIIHALGSVDELNTWVGTICVGLQLLEDRENSWINFLLCTRKKYPVTELYFCQEFLRTVQQNLLDLSSSVATVSGARVKSTRFGSREDVLEREIDYLDRKLPNLTRFIVPGTSTVESVIQTCRSVCRRAERDMAKVSSAFPLEPSVLIYLNRLSDYLFVLARFVNHVFEGGNEITRKSKQE